ncbi:site-specific integrase [Salinibacter grassmerensis]|uniref:site-specific integrase n=1 Tax=Salinibacter grassmerensis TaxID=3040353 RepID=UPI0021E7D9AE|nr:site-specific integrase [Salinibacter grassmerensis]
MSDLGSRGGSGEDGFLTGRERELADRAQELFEKRLSENTRKAYASGWRDFLRFCKEHGRDPLPASKETVALYLSDRSGSHAPTTLQVRLSAIQHLHDESGADSPT